VTAEQLFYLLPVVFPIFFIGLWLAVTTVLGRASGWKFLQGAYPDRIETPLVRLQLQSGSMGGRWGMPVNFNGCLRYDVCPTGLRVAIWRIFGWFQQPFFVPWGHITAEEKKMLFLTGIRLRFTGWPDGELIIRRRTFERMVEAAPLALRSR